MFEKFTERAINLISESQRLAKEMQNAYVQPEHLLIAVVQQAKGISLKMLRVSGITTEAVMLEVENKLRFEKSTKNNVPFSDEFKELLKNTVDFANKSGNKYVLFEHLFLAVINDKNSYNERILKHFNFDMKQAQDILYRLVQKKTKRLAHPEIEDVKEQEFEYKTTESFFEDETSILNSSRAKIVASNYEIIGTEQIISAILDEENLEVTNILKKNGITAQNFAEKLSESMRNLEYENEIMLTPSAKKMMILASETAKEVGSPVIKPEHIMLGLLKSKKGTAYETILKLNVKPEILTTEILKPIEDQMPQALTILRLAKQETRRLGRSVLGTEMILLGIINEGTGIGFEVLADLGITLKDTRNIIEKIIGYGNEYYDSEILFTRRAKRILEVAWQKAKKYKKPRIMSEHLLYAITTEPSSVAMKALEQLGVDAVEIRQGIKNCII